MPPTTGAVVILATLLASTAAPAANEVPSAVAVRAAFPPRRDDAPAGSEVARRIAGLSDADRQRALVEQIELGNVPAFLRTLRPVELRATGPSGQVIRATIYALPDYLAVGTDRDFVYAPLAWTAATEVARHYGCVLPTPKMVDAIYTQAVHRLEPIPLPAGPLMRSIGYLLTHQARIDAQLRGFEPGGLIAGHKKDVVLSHRLLDEVGRVAIYGWHRSAGHPIQPLSTVHGESYADYSHGLRLVSDQVVVDGQIRSVYDVLADAQLAPVLSGEGAIPGLRALLQGPRLLASHGMSGSIGP